MYFNLCHKTFVLNVFLGYLHDRFFLVFPSHLHFVTHKICLKHLFLFFYLCFLKFGVKSCPISPCFPACVIPSFCSRLPPSAEFLPLRLSAVCFLLFFPRSLFSLSVKYARGSNHGDSKLFRSSGQIYPCGFPHVYFGVIPPPPWGTTYLRENQTARSGCFPSGGTWQLQAQGKIGNCFF